MIGNTADWNVFQLPEIQARYMTLAAPIDSNEIAIFGGNGASREVLIFNIQSNSAVKAVEYALVSILSHFNKCVMVK